jgi:biopolymer transport protein ExbD
MRVPSHRSDRDESSAAMTPMIDVVFLLLIFFVCAAVGVVQESVLATDLAATGAVISPEEQPERDPWTVEVWLKLRLDAAGRRLLVDMNGTVYDDLDRLEGQLRQLSGVDASNPVILDIDATVPIGLVIDVYDRCRRAGLESVNFAADARDVANSAR